MFLSPTSDYNFKITTSNTIAIKNNLSYIKKFELPISITQYINARLIVNDVNINNSRIASDIELTLWVFYYLKSY